ncbi:MAG: diaminopimelate decarboxylase [Bacillota bacterium]
MNRSVILEQAKQNDSFYIYEEAHILQQIEMLQEAFPTLEILYSMKTNPNPFVVKTIFNQRIGVDAASKREAEIAKEHGVEKRKIQFSSPGKTDSDIESTISFATLIADSLGEVYRIQEIARKKGMTVDIGVRLNPNFTYTTDEGIPSKFGIDEDLFFAEITALESLSNISIVGLHVHIYSQELNTSYLKNYHKNVLALAKKMQGAIKNKLEFINLGSGIGIPYAKTDTPVDVDALGKSTTELIAKFHETFPAVKMYIETGRFLVGQSGTYATKVIDKKISHGKTFVLLHNTLNGFVRPAFASMLESYATPPILEPFYTCKNAFSYVVLNDETEMEMVTLGGNLCTGLDIIERDISLPRLSCGDVVAITNAGSYAAVISPMQFSSQVKPKELFLAIDGTVFE